MTLSASRQYEFARRIMAGGANAAVEGAFERRATEVMAHDNRGPA
ncbi:MAG: hypothetical protein HXS50_00060 [Theionarchaea archaeon]|nr:hypothetical protein [Theionarchaea archaeon]